MQKFTFLKIDVFAEKEDESGGENELTDTGN